MRVLVLEVWSYDMKLELTWNGICGALIENNDENDHGNLSLIIDGKHYSAGEVVRFDDGTWIGSDEFVVNAVSERDDAIDILKRYCPVTVLKPYM